MADRIGIIVELTGDKEAASSLENLKKTVTILNNNKVDLKLQSSDLDKQINNLRKQLDQLQYEAKNIRLEGGKGSTAALKEKQKEIAELTKQLNDLQRQKADLQIKIGLDTTAVGVAKDRIKEMESEAKEAEGALEGASEAMDGLGENADGAGEEVKEMVQDAITLRDVLSGIGTLFEGLGGAMQGVGNTMQGIGRMFGGDILNTARRTMTAYATLMATQGFRNSTSRFDTFRTFPKLMEAAGFSADDASTAVDKLNQAVLGLPTALDEIVDSAKQYIVMMNDIEKGTDLAIAANNAFLANATDANQVKFGMRQIKDILAKGTLRSQEWDSLFSAMGVSLRDIAKEAGYSLGEFTSGLKEGKIEAMEFVEALIKAGTGVGSLVEKANIQKDTMDAAITNIKNAFSNLGASIMQALDEELMKGTGEGLPGNIKRISDAIKGELIPAVKDWIHSHSDEILGFIDKLASYDWMGLVSKVGTQIYNFFSLIGKALGMLPEGAVQDFIAFAMVWATPIGKLLTMGGGVMKGIGGFFKTLAELNIGGLPVLGKVADGTKDVGRVVRSLSDMKRDFLGFTLTVAEIAEIGLVIAEYAKVVQMIADIKLGDDFLKNAAAVAGTLGAGGAITAIITGLMTLAGQSGVGGVGVGIGELLTAGFILELGMLGNAIGKYADVCQKISDLNVDWEKTRANAVGLSQVMTQLNWASALNSLFGLAGVIGATELSSISDAVGAVMDAMDQIARANFPTPEKLRLAKTMFGNLSDAFDLGFVEGFKAFVGNLFNVYGAEKNKIESSLEILNMFDDVAEVVDSMAGKTINTEAAGANISGLVLSLAKMAQDIKDAFGGDTELASSLKWVGQESKLMTNITTMFENVGKVMKSIQDIRNTYFGQGKIEGAFQPSIMSGFDTTKRNLEDFLKGVAEIVALLNPQNSPATALQGEWETSSEARMIGNIQKAFANIGTMLTDLRTINKTFGKMTKGGMSVGGSIGYAIANIRTALTQISKLFSEDLFKDLPDLGKIGMVNEKEVEGSTGGKLANLALAVESLKKVMYALRVINGDMTSGKGEAIDFSAVTGNIQTAVEGLNAVFGAIPEDMQGTVLEKVTALQSAMTQLQSAVTTLQSIQTSLSGEEGGTDTSGLTQMITNITTALSSANIDTSGIDAIATSVETLKTMLQEVANVDFSAVTGQTGTLKSGLDNVKDSAMQAKAAFEQMGGAGSSAAARISGSIQSIISSINSAINRIYALQNAINTLHGKTVNVNVNVNQHGSVSSATRGVQPHTGGYIGRNGNLLYRASGGPIFRPRGTDTVPAMLTPGEYVMNRRAVQAFGVNFMRNVNRLNISAALRSLVSRTNMPSTHSTVINNSRNYDNHATVNQNIYTNNQAFGFRRANRYVEAL